jgi:hypothetical protein
VLDCQRYRTRLGRTDVPDSVQIQTTKSRERWLSYEGNILCLESPDLNLDPDIAVSLGEEIAY